MDSAFYAPQLKGIATKLGIDNWTIAFPRYVRKHQLAPSAPIDAPRAPSELNQFVQTSQQGVAQLMGYAINLESMAQDADPDLRQRLLAMAQTCNAMAEGIKNNTFNFYKCEYHVQLMRQKLQADIHDRQRRQLIANAATGVAARSHSHMMLASRQHQHLERQKRLLSAQVDSTNNGVINTLLKGIGRENNVSDFLTLHKAFGDDPALMNAALAEIKRTLQSSNIGPKQLYKFLIQKVGQAAMNRQHRASKTTRAAFAAAQGAAPLVLKPLPPTAVNDLHTARVQTTQALQRAQKTKPITTRQRAASPRKIKVPSRRRTRADHRINMHDETVRMITKTQFNDAQNRSTVGPHKAMGPSTTRPARGTHAQVSDIANQDITQDETNARARARRQGRNHHRVSSHAAAETHRLERR